MAKLITKFKYLKPSARQSVGGYAKYIATREGVEKVDDTFKSDPATGKQKKLIEKILRDFPDSKTMLEYEDYLNAPTLGNASEFIARALEDNAQEVLNSKTYADYIATRPRAERFGSHGLFTDDGVRVKLEDVSEELNAHEGNVWTVILSLRREDAERLGFNSGKRWRDMLRTQTETIAKNFKIPVEDLKWYAAFHNESHHPHVHLMVYSSEGATPYLTQKGVMNLRSVFAKDIFADDLLSIYEKQTEHRNRLRGQSRDVIAEIVSRINSGVYDNPVIESKLLTDEQKEQARQTDLCELLRSQGEKLKRSGSEYEWRDGSQKVTIRGNLWFHQYDREGGDAIDFIRRFYHKDYPEAVEYLLGGCGGTLIVSPPIERKPSKPFELPPRNENMHRVYAYLLSRRGLDRDVVNTFVYQKMIYESAKYHNAVFVGFDQDGIPRHANLRGTGSESTFKGNADGSTPEYSFHRHGTSDRLYLFEAPIDMLSFISLYKEHWKMHSYAAACGVSDHVLWQMMKDNAKIQKVYLCLDNDEPGQAAAKRISDKLFIKGVPHEILVPIHKDWNEDLLYPTEESEEEGEIECQAL